MTRTTRTIRAREACRCRTCGKRYDEGDVIPAECPDCGDEGDGGRPRRLTRTEAQQAMADNGIDTWEEARGER